MTRLTIRIDFDNGTALGPGKVRLLEQIGETGSIRKAAAGMKMSYRRAWLLLKALEESFGQPLVATARGGAKGGGARLTGLGDEVVVRYRSLEQGASEATRSDFSALAELTVGPAAKLPQRSKVRRITK